MARYFFHLHECGTITRDPEGREFGDVAAALDAARVDARAIMAAEVLRGALCLGCFIRVEAVETGEQHDLLFRDVLAVSGIAPTTH